MFKHILIPTDGSETATKAVQAGIDFARDANAKVTWFTAVPEYQLPSQADILAHHEVVTPVEYAKRVEGEAASLFQDIVRQAKSAGIDCDTDFVQSDRPYEAIIDAAKRHGCDLIFMASHGRRGISALVHGSETRDVLTHSDIPTLVYR